MKALSCALVACCALSWANHLAIGSNAFGSVFIAGLALLGLGYELLKDE